MATVINVPRDTRFKGLGKGAADFLTTFAAKREEESVKQISRGLLKDC